MKQLPKLKSIKDIKIIENMGAEIEFDPQEEDHSPDDNYMEQGSIDYIVEQYDNGNMAAWFCAHVTVKFKGYEGEDYLGGCSYKSFKEFTTMENDYYVDMINSCIDELNKDIVSDNENTQKRWNIRKAKNLIAPYGLHIVTSNVLQTV